MLQTLLSLCPACADHTFGQECKHQCNCPDGAICNKVDGTCPPVTMCDVRHEGEDCTSQKGITEL